MRVLSNVDVARVTFGQPAFLWLLIVPGALFGLATWRFFRRRADVHRLARERMLPVKERFGVAGDLPFWGCLVVAVALLAIALARPQGPTAAIRRGGIDLVVLLDGSASMRVADVAGDRWQRSVRFLRVLGNALGWTDDRMALSLFAYLATPQVRLTHDPNTFFFFLEHLGDAPPYRLEDETSWDTNVELGIQWGMRMLERDETMHGRSTNAKMFVVITDGEAWSGEVEKALDLVRDRHVPLYVVGVGTLAGGLLPDVIGEDGGPMLDAGESRISQLDREGLQRIAAAGGGEYFELDRDGDRQIANRLIDAGRRRAPTVERQQAADELHWRVLGAAAAVLAVGVVFLRERTELWLQLGAAATILAALWTFF